MAKNAATELALGELHAKVAKVMTRALDQLDKAQDAFDNAVDADADNTEILALKPEIPSNLLGVITKFLADNKITCAPEDSEQMTDLEKALAEKRTSRRKSVRDVDTNVIPFGETG